MKKLFLLFAIVACAINVLAQTDTLVLVNNDVIVGEIKGLERGVLTFETDYSDSDFKIEWLNVKEVKSSQVFIMTFSNGDRKNGTIKTDPNDPKKVIITEADGQDTGYLINQVVYLKSVENDFISKFSASVDIGYTYTKARNNQQFTARSNLAYLTNAWGADANFDAVRSVQDSAEDISRTEANIGARVFLYRDVFATASGNFLQNNEQKLSLRSVYNIGIGEYLVNTNHMYLIFTIGAAYNDEQYTDPSIAGRQDAEGLAAIELNLFDMGDLSLLTSAKLYPSITSPGRYRTDLKFDIKYDFPLDLYIKFGTTYNFDSNPVEGAAKSDYVIQTTLGWEWN